MAAGRAYRVVVDAETCDGCGICIFYCKPVVFEQSRELNRRGFYPAVPVRSDACTNCGLCEVACPQLSIGVKDAVAVAAAGGAEGGVTPAGRGAGGAA